MKYGRYYIRKVFKYTSITLMCLLILFGLILLFSYINHVVQLSKEEKLFVPIGNKVQVGENMMNVYTEGDDEKTLVFMAGGGTSSPVLDFKSLLR